jgi:hypothetical protein
MAPRKITWEELMAKHPGGIYVVPVPRYGVITGDMNQANHLVRMATAAAEDARAPFTRAADDELNQCLVRLGDEGLPSGKRRTCKQVRAELKRINPWWARLRTDNAARARYRREKTRPSDG